MIYTVTLNPALDYIMRAERFVLGAVNRARGEEILPGGKGINVSYVLRELGIPSVALGFAAGFTGDELERMVRARGIQTEFIRVLGSTRINVKVRAEQETDINGCGPLAQDKDIIALAHKLHAAEANSVCVLSGSAPASLSSDCYVRLFNQADRPDMRIALDASGALLRRSLTLGPWLIKPNREELEELCGRALAGREAVACAARELRGLGARNVLVSLGEAGACLFTEDGKEYFVSAPQGCAIDTVGAGDSLLAGFLAAKECGASDFAALEQGVAAGSATAFRIGLATGEEIGSLLKCMRDHG